MTRGVAIDIGRATRAGRRRADPPDRGRAGRIHFRLDAPTGAEPRRAPAA